VTNNLKDFDFAALAALGVTVRSPDDFLTDLFDANPALVDAVTREAADNLTQSTPSWDECLVVHAQFTDSCADQRAMAMKKHNHSSDDRLIQYRGKYSRHSRGQALTEFASDRNTGATCLKPSSRTNESPAPSFLVSLSSS
jgi:hypothetical protein